MGLAPTFAAAAKVAYLLERLNPGDPRRKYLLLLEGRLLSDVNRVIADLPFDSDAFVAEAQRLFEASPPSTGLPVFERPSLLNKRAFAALRDHRPELAARLYRELADGAAEEPLQRANARWTLALLRLRDDTAAAATLLRDAVAGLHTSGHPKDQARLHAGSLNCAVNAFGRFTADAGCEAMRRDYPTETLPWQVRLGVAIETAESLLHIDRVDLMLEVFLWSLRHAADANDEARWLLLTHVGAGMADLYAEISWRRDARGAWHLRCQDERTACVDEMALATHAIAGRPHAHYTYAMQNPEEDRAETFSYFAVPETRAAYIDWIRRDLDRARPTFRPLLKALAIEWFFVPFVDLPSSKPGAWHYEVVPSHAYTNPALVATEYAAEWRPKMLPHELALFDRILQVHAALASFRDPAPAARLAQPVSPSQRSRRSPS